MKTEIWPDFKIERHEDYTVIWPMRFYRDEEEKKFKREEITITSEEVSDIFRKYWPDADYKAWCILIAICWLWLLLYILSPIIIAIERYYWIDV